MKKYLLLLSILGILNKPTKAEELYIELKDCTLFDAVDMLYKVGGNESKYIHPEAKNINIGSLSLQKADWYETVILLVKRSNFVLYKNNQVSYIVPRKTK